MSDYTVQQFRDAARAAMEAGDTASAKKLIQRGMALEQSQLATPKGKALDVAKSAASGLVEGAANMSDQFYDFMGGRVISDGLDLIEIATGRDMPSLPRVSDAVSAHGHTPKTTAGEYAKTIGEFLPYSVAGPAGVARGVGTMAISGAASEAAGQATEGRKLPGILPVVGGMDAEPFARTAAAVVAPTVASGLLNTGKNLVTPNPAEPARIAAARRLKSEGVDLTAGQTVGNRSLMYQEDTAKRTQQVVDTQARQFTQAVLRRIGVKADRATPEVMEEATTRIGGMFNDLAKRNSITADKQLARDIGRALASYKEKLTTSDAVVPPLLKNIARDINAALKSGKPISGKQYQEARTKLGSVKPTSEAFDAARQVRAALDNAMGRTLTVSGMPADLAKYQTARQQYKDLLAIEDALARPGGKGGIVTPQNLRPGVVRQGKRSYVTGQSDLGELSRAGSIAMEALPQSGTTPRGIAMGLDMAAGATTGGMTGLLAHSMGAGPVSTGLAGAGAAVAPAVRRSFTASKLGQSYLANQILTGRKPTMQPLPGLMALLASSGH